MESGAADLTHVIWTHCTAKMFLDEGSMVPCLPAPGRPFERLEREAAETKKANRQVRFSTLAAGEGVEPSHTDPESAVLPLDDPAILVSAL